MKKSFLTLLPILMVLLGISANTRGDGFIHIMPPFPGRPVTPLAVNYHKVEVQITDQVAKTLVDQEFYNPNRQVLEGIYMFPVPRGASLDKFSMFIDGKETPAELLDAAKARTIYEDIVRKMKDPALLEYVDRDLFKVRVYPIPAAGTKRVKLSYNEVLKTDAGLCRYVYPLNTEKFSSSPIQTVSFKLTLKSKFPIKNIYCPTHAVEISRKSDYEAIIGYEATRVKPDRDVEIIYSVDDKEVGVNLLTYKPAGEDGFFMCLLSPKFTMEKGREIQKDVVFLLDTSGSMADDNKLQQAKKALEFCLRNLGDQDRFNIVRFSTEAEKFQDKLVTFQSHIDPTMDFVRKLKPTGGTNINEALVEALKLKEDNTRPFLVVFITDGLPTVGETNIKEILSHVKSENKAGTRIFCFGVGYDVNTHLLDQIAETTRSFSQYVKPNEDIEVKVSGFFDKVKDPVLTQIALKFGTIKVKDIYPHQMPDLFRGSQLMAVGRYEGSGKTAIRLDGMINEGKNSFTYDAVFGDKAEANDFIPRIWATQKVAYLLDEIRLHGDNKELVTEVTQLAKRYGIVTPYTSYLILEDEKQLDRIPSVSGGPRPILGPRVSVHSMMMAKDEYKAMRAASSGKGAVMASERLNMMKQSNIAGGSGGLNYSGVNVNVAGKEVDLATQVRNIENKTFFFNGTQWVDTESATHKDQKKIVITYMSEEYFKLLRQNPVIGKFLALGENVLLSFNGTTYEINK
jgi:Ca-activated chloride channel family protein